MREEEVLNNRPFAQRLPEEFTFDNGAELCRQTWPHLGHNLFRSQKFEKFQQRKSKRIVHLHPMMNLACRGDCALGDALKSERLRDVDLETWHFTLPQTSLIN